MRFILEGAIADDYAAAVSRTNSDIQTLNTTCSTG